MACFSKASGPIINLIFAFLCELLAAHTQTDLCANELAFYCG